MPKELAAGPDVVANMGDYASKDFREKFTMASTPSSKIPPHIDLPPAETDSRTPLLEALCKRRTTREISSGALPVTVLSNLLWCAFGVNRPIGPFGQPGRTAASASNSQEIDLYVCMRDGAYRYDGCAHRLEPVTAADLRSHALTPGQRGIEATAPVQLIFVVDVHRLTHTAGFQEPGLHDAETQKSYYYVDTGIIAAHVYLFAAAHDLAAWFHNCDRPSLARQLDLGAQQRVLFAQSVGYAATTR